MEGDKKITNINIAILGYGVVGGGVAQVLTENAALLKKRLGKELYIKYILDLRTFKGDRYENRVISDYNKILADETIEIVAEMLGGVKPAYEYTKAALLAGKSVVTSNKELVARHGVEFRRLAEENGVRYMFEASVGGGIPIITPLEELLVANEITEICGIVNGTTNYILTEMKKGIDFSHALAQAQKNGYAEANPSADIEGLDSCRKICILAAVAFGVLFDPDWVSVRGILEITQEDMECAEENNAVIKLIARAVKLENGKINLMVAPFAVNKDNPLAAIDGVYNGILVRGNAVGDVMFYGKGAGRLPTASAVVSDIMHIAAHLPLQHKQPVWEKGSAEHYATSLSPNELEKAKETIGSPLFFPECIVQA